MSPTATKPSTAKNTSSTGKASTAKSAPKKPSKPKLDNTAPRSGSVLSIDSAGYHKIAYQDWGDEKSEETVFCVHGLTRNSHDFDRLASRLAEKRRVICPDTVGRGKSDWLADHDDYQISQYNLDLTVLAAKFSCEKFDLIGTSLGGMMGMILASMENSPIRRLVINDIAPEVPHSAMTRLGRYLHTDPYFEDLDNVEKYLRKTLAPFHPMTDDDWKRIAITSSWEADGGYRLAFDPNISNNYRRYWLLVFFNLWKYWSKIKCPVLILRGKKSDFLTESLLEKMRAKLPHADLIEFDEAGHTPTLNAPEQIDPILDWLDKN